MGGNVLIRNGHIVDPSQGIDGVGELLIENGRIKWIGDLGSGIGRKGKTNPQLPTPEPRIIDAAGLHVFPGLVDMHAHLREPGFENKETIASGTMAAVKGGFTSVCCMPNTDPVNDNETVTEFILRKNHAEGSCYVYPIGAISKGQKGEELAEMGMMREAGCVAFSDDGRPVMNGLVMRRALEYSKVFDVPIISHCEDLTLSEGGVMNEGEAALLLGLSGIPSSAEEVMVARDVILAGLTGGRLHIAHVSTEGSVRIIRQAKEKGIRVTAETCPHYFSITEDAVEGYNTDAKVNPPLRRQRDIDAIMQGLMDGTIDVIATDHAPHHRDEKRREFDKAPFGISGLETAVSLSLRLVHTGVLTMPQLVEKMALNPARILGLQKGTLKAGSDADVVVIDGEKEWAVDPEGFVSKGKNTPFRGWVLKGKPVMVLCKGRIHE
jgi:dihydroorotase